MPRESRWIGSLLAEAASPSELQAWPGLGEELDRIWEDARAAWPDLPSDPEGFFAHLGRLLPPRGSRAAVEKVRAPDLYLAYRCSLSDPVALRLLEGRYLERIRGHLAGLRRDAAFADDALQRFRETLFLPSPSGPPKIATYSGRGALSGWLRMVAVRAALQLLRASGVEIPDGAAIARTAAPDPELDHLRARYRAEFGEAFKATLAALSEEQRNALRLHYLDGKSLIEIGKLLKVHRVTVGRWVQGARQTLLEETRARLKARLGMDSGELDSAMGLIASRLDLTLSSLLGE
jgi:RNA polymerase sigma-70 factor (ECF subfamily)